MQHLMILPFHRNSINERPKTLFIFFVSKLTQDLWNPQAYNFGCLWCCRYTVKWVRIQCLHTKEYNACLPRHNMLSYQGAKTAWARQYLVHWLPSLVCAQVNKCKLGMWPVVVQCTMFTHSCADLATLNPSINSYYDILIYKHEKDSFLYYYKTNYLIILLKK